MKEESEPDPAEYINLDTDVFLFFTDTQSHTGVHIPTR